MVIVRESVSIREARTETRLKAHLQSALVTLIGIHGIQLLVAPRNRAFLLYLLLMRRTVESHVFLHLTITLNIDGVRQQTDPLRL